MNSSHIAASSLKRQILTLSSVNCEAFKEEENEGSDEEELIDQPVSVDDEKEPLEDPVPFPNFSEDVLVNYSPVQFALKDSKVKLPPVARELSLDQSSTQRYPLASQEKLTNEQLYKLSYIDTEEDKQLIPVKELARRFDERFERFEKCILQQMESSGSLSVINGRLDALERKTSLLFKLQASSNHIVIYLSLSIVALLLFVLLRDGVRANRRIEVW